MLPPSTPSIPQAAAAAINLAYDLEHGGRFGEAIEVLQAALRRYPDLAEVQWRLGLMLLREGDFAGGWPLFERRPINMGGRAAGKPRLSFPEWDGSKISSLLILPEQGLGDQIMFARYAPLLKARGIEVAILCHPALGRLFDRLGVRVLPALGHVEFPRFDAWVLGPSLPFRVGEIPEQPYLRAAGVGEGVGLLTRGNPRHVNDKIRSLPAELSAEIASWDDMRSLEQGAIGSQDLEDTARVVEGLELVISVDTAIAHLAGALGKPCWLLLPHVSDWRWLRDRSDSPWYPSMRLFRQPKPGDWTSVIRELQSAFAERRTFQAQDGSSS